MRQGGKCFFLQSHTPGPGEPLRGGPERPVRRPNPLFTNANAHWGEPQPSADRPPTNKRPCTPHDGPSLPQPEPDPVRGGPRNGSAGSSAAAGCPLGWPDPRSPRPGPGPSRRIPPSSAMGRGRYCTIRRNRSGARSSPHPPASATPGPRIGSCGSAWGSAGPSTCREPIRGWERMEANDRRIESLKAQLVPGPAPFGGKPVLPPSQLARGPFTAPPQSRMARPATEIEPPCVPDESGRTRFPAGSRASVELQETVSQDFCLRSLCLWCLYLQCPCPKSPCSKSLCPESRPRRRSMLKVRCPLPPIRRST